LSCKWFALEEEEEEVNDDDDDDDESRPFRRDDQEEEEEEEEKESMKKMPPKQEETGIHEYSHDTSLPKSKSVVVAQVPSKKEKGLSSQDTDDEIDTALPSSSSMSLSCTPSPRKLRQSRPDLFFLGIVVKVNGYTDPCNETLKRMLQKHGGDLETYETLRVTHIIAESLSKAKADIYKKQKQPIPVCTPAWIVESVQAGKLLAYGNYLLDQLRDPQHNRIAASFFLASTSTKKQPPQESNRKVQNESSWTKQQGSDPFPCRQPDSSRSSTRRIMPQPQTEEATDVDLLVTDHSEECKPLIDNTDHVESFTSTSTSGKQTPRGTVLSLKGVEDETAPASSSSILGQHHSSAESTYRRDQASTPPGTFKVYNIGGGGSDSSEDEAMEFPMVEQQSPISSADPDETSEIVLAFPNAKVAVSVVEKEEHEEKDSDQQVGPAKQIERRGLGKSDDKYIDGKIRTTGTLLFLIWNTLRYVGVGSKDSLTLYSFLIYRNRSQLFGFIFQQFSVEFHWKLQTENKNNGEPTKRGHGSGVIVSWLEAVCLSCRHGLLLCQCGSTELS
jgi:hypothetical protein